MVPGPGWPGGLAGVVAPPVGRGVERLDGMSAVKVLDDGERMYFCVMVESNALVKPAFSLTVVSKLCSR